MAWCDDAYIVDRPSQGPSYQQGVTLACCGRWEDRYIFVKYNFCFIGHQESSQHSWENLEQERSVESTYDNSNLCLYFPPQRWLAL